MTIYLVGFFIYLLLSMLLCTGYMMPLLECFILASFMDLGLICRYFSNIPYYRGLFVRKWIGFGSRNLEYRFFPGSFS